jgi:hypothetical protein
VVWQADRGRCLSSPTGMVIVQAQSEGELLDVFRPHPLWIGGRILRRRVDGGSRCSFVDVESHWKELVSA